MVSVTVGKGSAPSCELDRRLGMEMMKMYVRRRNGEESNDATAAQLKSPMVCLDCRTSKTPMWRLGPSGPKSLCNACGIRYRRRMMRLGFSGDGGGPNKTSTHRTADSGNGKLLGLRPEKLKRRQKEKQKRVLLMLMQRQRQSRAWRRRVARRPSAAVVGGGGGREEVEAAAFLLLSLSSGIFVH